jgi:hypothetical protein
LGAAWFEVESFRVITDDEPFTAPGWRHDRATIKVHVGRSAIATSRAGQ